MMDERRNETELGRTDVEFTPDRDLEAGLQYRGRDVERGMRDRSSAMERGTGQRAVPLSGILMLAGGSWLIWRALRRGNGNRSERSRNRSRGRNQYRGARGRTRAGVQARGLDWDSGGEQDYNARYSQGVSRYGRGGDFDTDRTFRSDYGSRYQGDYGRQGYRYGYGQGAGTDYGDYGTRRYGTSDYGGAYGRYGSEVYNAGDYGTDYELGFGDEGLPEDYGWNYTETWRIPGPHRGRGPQGYQRSVDRIREDVSDRLTQHGEIDASNIQVKVENNEVTLEGTVDSRRSKRLAEDLAEDVFGVTEVHNHLRVQQAQG